MRNLLIAILCAALGALAWGEGTIVPIPGMRSGLGLAWAPDGNGLALVYLDKGAVFRVRLVEPAGYTTIWEVPLGELPVGSTIPWISRLSFSPDGKLLAVGMPGEVRVLSSESGATVKELPVGDNAVPAGLCFLYGGLLAVVAHAEHWPIPPLAEGTRATISFQVWDMAWRISEKPVVIGERPIPSLTRPLDAFSRKAQVLASLNLYPDGEDWILSFLLKSGEGGGGSLTDLAGTAAPPTAIALSPDGREAAVGFSAAGPGPIPLIERVDLVSWEVVGEYLPSEAAGAQVIDLAYSPDGETIALSYLAGDHTQLGLIGLEGGEETILCRDEDSGCPDCCLSFSPDGRYLVAAGHGGVYLWRIGR